MHPGGVHSTGKWPCWTCMGGFILHMKEVPFYRERERERERDPILQCATLPVSFLPGLGRGSKLQLQNGTTHPFYWIQGGIVRPSLVHVLSAPCFFPRGKLLMLQALWQPRGRRNLSMLGCTKFQQFQTASPIWKRARQSANQSLV